MDFHQTGYGRKFFDYDLPELVKNTGKIADQLAKANQLKEKEQENKVFVVAYIDEGLLQESYVENDLEKATALAHNLHERHFDKGSDEGYICIEVCQIGQKEPGERIFQLSLDEEI